MRVSQLFVWAAVVVGMAGCQTLTEELPSQPTGNLPSIPVLPPVVIPVPIPTPEAPSGGPPVAPPTNPNPNPNPTPPPNGGGNPNGQIPNNTNPVAKVGAKVYFLECGGVQVPGSEFATSAQVGCRIHFDCTPKDAANDPTQAQGAPNWTFNGPVSVGNTNDFTPTVTAQSAGNLTAYVVIDGVTSNTLNVQIYN
jgi:hypothetical protein